MGRLSQLEAQFHSEKAELKAQFQSENAALKTQLEKANERIDRLEGNVKPIESDTSEKSWLMPTSCVDLYKSNNIRNAFYMILNAKNNIDVVFCDFSGMYSLIRN